MEMVNASTLGKFNLIEIYSSQKSAEHATQSSNTKSVHTISRFFPPRLSYLGPNKEDHQTTN